MTDPREDNLKKFIKQASKLGIKTEDQLHRSKKTYARKNSLSLPTNWSLQKAYEDLIDDGWEGDDKLQRLMRKRKIRTLSGVSVLTTLTKPYRCPGKCVFCPSEPGMPKSYLSNEPGAMRAVLEDFDPTKQVLSRLDSLTKQGHETDKIEMIILGGTFSVYERDYQEEFVKAIFDACNHGTESKADPSASAATTSTTPAAANLQEAQIKNESAAHKIIGLSLETRGDQITQDEVRHLRYLGCTKVQMGVQHLDNAVLALNKRGETVKDVMRAFQLLKDAGFKIAAHLMPNLPGSTPERDVQMIREFFENPAFRADQLKLYPCVVTPYSELEQWWKEGKYQSYDDQTLMRILLEMKKSVPEYVRIERLYRDIPGESILAGSQKTNMRQLLHDQMKKDAVHCGCIRCREIKGEEYDPDGTELRILPYDSSGGKEFFISFNDTERDKICSLLRLRFPSQLFTGKPHFIPELEGAAIIREVHTYGAQVRVGDSGGSSGDTSQHAASQHAGLGRRMLEKAEQLTREAGYSRIAVIAGVGTRNYYRKWGYELDGTYMTKEL